MPKGSQKNKTSRDPVDGRASPGAVTEGEQMEEDGIESLRPASTARASERALAGGKGGKKRKTVEKVVDSGGEEEPVVNKPAPVKRARTKSAPVAPSAVEATEGELDTGAAEATEEKREKSAEDLSRERHGAKGRGYRNLAGEAGYDPTPRLRGRPRCRLCSRTPMWCGCCARAADRGTHLLLADRGQTAHGADARLNAGCGGARGKFVPRASNALRD